MRRSAITKAPCICWREKKIDHDFDRTIAVLNQRLSPDNIFPRSPAFIHGDGLATVVFNCAEEVAVRGTSVYPGKMVAPTYDWWRPQGNVPDGTYALFRSDRDTLELVSDVVASRTIWYVQTEKLFATSSSQRAIVFFLRNFEENRNAYLWTLSSGTLGPNNL